MFSQFHVLTSIGTAALALAAGPSIWTWRQLTTDQSQAASQPGTKYTHCSCMSSCIAAVCRFPSGPLQLSEMRHSRSHSRASAPISPLPAEEAPSPLEWGESAPPLAGSTTQKGDMCSAAQLQSPACSQGCHFSMEAPAHLGSRQYSTSLTS